MNLIFHLPSHPSDAWNLSGGPSSQNTMPQLSACSHLQVCFCDQDFKAICRKLSKSLEAAFPILCLFSKLLFSSSVFSPEFCFCLLHHNFRFFSNPSRQRLLSNSTFAGDCNTHFSFVNFCKYFVLSCIVWMCSSRFPVHSVLIKLYNILFQQNFQTFEHYELHFGKFSR